MIRRKHRGKKPKRRAEPRILVKPSPESEARISLEAAKARQIAQRPSPANLLLSPYLVSAIYYHDGLLDSFDANRTDADPADRIVAHIAESFGPRTKADFIDSLRECCALSYSELGPGRFIPPVAYEPLGRGGAVHRNAIDLFAAEGTRVRSATRGLVVLAESGWVPGDWFSTSTVRGGNTVIVFDPDGTRFLRYAHLEKASVTPGLLIEAGEEIGVVGHTGFNASRPGHGRHLHFEINEFANGAVRATPNEELRALLEAVSGECRARAPSTALQTAPG